MGLEIIIINILWFLISLFFIVQYAPACKDLKRYEQISVFLLLVAVGPIFLAAALFEKILSTILPEGWDDDDPGPLD
jgi:hypothetical protein